ncbi:surface-adhesin E family protein [Dickeya zeae]|uniref:surface-adhesin E family protein n=1 Tax=Dickeya zeae TaxID=204042 RepID=UPI000C9A1304|nr:surface-adhesin E family protein [Dickeya zeae]AUQ24490.1 hypothetical protein C1O30_05115 [Dickeya zeae]UJR57595.1 hypothetical protein HJ580_05080 [Dickeya zeae]
MKHLILCTALTLLAGCSSSNKVPTVGPRPAGLLKMLEDSTGGTYADMRSISSYQNNTHLRRFFLINNYIGPKRVQTEPPIYVSSSRVINVVNCDTQERAQFERIYFSQYWGQGDAILKRETVGQWEKYPKESLIGIVADSICKIDPTHLKPEPPKDTRVPLLGNML